MEDGQEAVNPTSNDDYRPYSDLEPENDEAYGASEQDLGETPGGGLAYENGDAEEYGGVIVPDIDLSTYRDSEEASSAVLWDDTEEDEADPIIENTED